MPKFPVDAPIDRVIASLGILGFSVIRSGNHIALARENPDGTRATVTIPNHRVLKGSTLRTVLTLAQVSREEFLKAYEKA